MSNAQLFSAVAREYANFRPGYPPELFAWLARISPARDAVWDCGCGSGQASVALAEHFSVVHATDVAPEQIAAARPHPRVRYSVAPAERSGLADARSIWSPWRRRCTGSTSTAFYAEAQRVARRGAVLVVWTYPRPQFVDAELDHRFFGFYSDVVGPYWPPERKHVETGYRTLPFPFEEIAAPGIRHRARLESRAGHGLREQLVGHCALSRGAGRGSGAAAAAVAARRVAGSGAASRCACLSACAPRRLRS